MEVHSYVCFRCFVDDDGGDDDDSILWRRTSYLLASQTAMTKRKNNWPFLPPERPSEKMILPCDLCTAGGVSFPVDNKRIHLDADDESDSRMDLLVAGVVVVDAGKTGLERSFH